MTFTTIDAADVKTWPPATVQRVRVEGKRADNGRPYEWTGRAAPARLSVSEDPQAWHGDRWALLLEPK